MYRLLLICTLLNHGFYLPLQLPRHQSVMKRAAPHIAVTPPKCKAPSLGLRQVLLSVRYHLSQINM